MDMLWTEALLNGLRWKNVTITTSNHFIRINPLVPRHINRQRIIAQRLHFIRRQISIRVISKYSVLPLKQKQTKFSFLLSQSIQLCDKK